MSVGGGPIQAKVEAQPQPTEETTRVLIGLLDLPLTLLKRNGQRTLVAFDEFQDLLAVDPKIDGLVRSRIQRHGDAASYIFAGSHPGLMEQLFGTRERPFLRPSPRALPGSARGPRPRRLHRRALRPANATQRRSSARSSISSRAPATRDASCASPLGTDSSRRGGYRGSLATGARGSVAGARRGVAGHLGRLGGQGGGGPCCSP